MHNTRGLVALGAPHPSTAGSHLTGILPRPAVFLDRDGVIVRAAVRQGKSYAPRDLKSFRLLPGAAAAVQRLHKAGYLIVVVTNQPDIGNGLVDPAVVAEMHRRIGLAMPIDAIEMCPHRQTEGCACRKPGIGLFEAAAARLAIDFPRSCMVGDRNSDVAAGRSVGCYTVFIDRGYDRCAKENPPDAVVRSLPEAARHILARTRAP